MTPELRRRLRDAAILVAALTALAGLFGVLVLVSGIVPIGASSGHWTLTSTLLEFASSRSVATWSAGVKPPPLDHPADVLKGAGHYHTGCRPCHGSPDLPQPRIALALTPPAPFLPPDQYRHKVEVLEQHCAEVGRDPSTITRSVNLTAAKDEAELEARFGGMARWIADQYPVTLR